MNSTVAIADCRGCSVADVLPSSFIISCSSCSAPVVLPDRQQRARRYNVVRRRSQSSPHEVVFIAFPLQVCRLCHAHIAFAFGCIKVRQRPPEHFCYHLQVRDLQLLASAPSDFARVGSAPARGRKICMQVHVCDCSAVFPSATESRCLL
jgi:hypothetical protein